MKSNTQRSVGQKHIALMVIACMTLLFFSAGLAMASHGEKKIEKVGTSGT